MRLTDDLPQIDWTDAGDCLRCGGPLGEKPRKVEAYGDRQVPCWNASDHICGARHGSGLNRCELRKRDCQRLSSQERAARLGVAPSKLAMSAGDVVQAIRAMHATRPGQSQEWLLLEEFDTGARRVDVLAIRLWTSRGLHMRAYEVKVSRADLALELANPAKREPAMEMATQFFFATPVGLMAPGEVPDGCGLLEFGVDRRNRPHWEEAVAAPYDRKDCAPPDLVVRLAWRVRDIELRARRRGISL